MIKLSHPHIQANIYYLTPQEGGRSVPISSGYRGQFHINGCDWDAGQEFIGKLVCNPGDDVDVLIQFSSAHKFLTLSEGLKFEIREGAIIVGVGVISKLLDLSLTSKTDSQNLYSIIDQILWTDWDPIGINDASEGRDEYQCYLPQVYSLKIKKADQETIAKHLLKIEIERMGLPGNIDNCRKVALKILSA